LGLVLFRRNQTEAAVGEMRKATLLEPMVSLYNSYLGKAYYEVKQDRQAKKSLALAKQLDPHDPTPWLYDAIRLQSINRPVEAVENLQKSIELNDDRGVYRSRLLLDEDLAARAATLGRIYNEIGFRQLGLNEGWQSVNRDPTNYSAHRLLADSYSALPQHEAARVSELLQSQLLQPVNITPVQPQMAETKLMIPGAGPITSSLYEFNPLFVRDRPTIFASALSGNQNTWGDDLIVSGLTDRFSYSFGQFHYQSDGYRENNDLKNDIYDLFVQAFLTPDFSLQAEYRHRETTQGDLRSIFDGTFDSLERRAINQDMARVGARYSLSPQTNVIASLIYADRNDALSYPPLDETYNLELRRKGYQAEAQLLYKRNVFNLITGLRVYALDETHSGFEQLSNTSKQEIAYGYMNIKFPDNLILTLGLSYESDEHPSSNLNELNPKFGVQWTINDNVSLRAAAFKIVKRSFAVDQTIEPTQVAGFNQFFDNFAMTVSKNYGVGLNVRFNDQLFGGLEALRRNLEVPLGVRGEEFFEIERAQEDRYNAYLYWLPSHDWAISVSYLYEGFKVKEGTLGQLYFATPAQLRTISIPLDIRYFDPSGFFAGLGIVYVNQHTQSLDRDAEILPTPILPTQSENFVLVDAGLGYRLPKQWGVFTLEATNLLDRKFDFQDYSFLSSDDGVNPRFIPERTFFARFVLNF
jgi:tetratricopeptide (TPR) repeat protein